MLPQARYWRPDGLWVVENPVKVKRFVRDDERRPEEGGQVQGEWKYNDPREVEGGFDYLKGNL